MIEIHSLAEAEKALLAFIPSGPVEKRYSLDRIRTLMAFLGNPQNSMKIIHVAGTSGKTSTAYYCAALLREAGYSVGLTVSPHIDTVSERAQINLAPLDDDTYCHDLSTFLTLVEQSGVVPSYFEVLIAFAFWLFQQQNVEYAVIEVGIGGLLDSTNIIDRPDKTCVITDIGFDHVALLGTTLPDIAAQKAGIIHPHNTVFMYEQGHGVSDVVRTVCDEVNAQLIIANSPDTAASWNTHLPSFQQRNFNLALTAVQHLLKGLLTADHIKHAANTYIPARAEEVIYQGKTLVLDGSHNPQKLTALVGSLSEHSEVIPTALLVSFGENKELSIEENLQILRKLSDSIVITAFWLGEGTPRRAIDPSIIAAAAQHVGFRDITVEPDPQKAFDLLLQKEAQRLVITGSFYLLNHVRPIVIK